MSWGGCKPQTPAMVSGSSHKAMRQSEFCTPGGLDGEMQPMLAHIHGWMALESPSGEWLTRAERKTYDRYQAPRRGEISGQRADASRTNSKSPALNGDPLNQKQRDKAQSSVRFTKRKPARSATLEEERKNGDQHVGLARRLRSPHIGSGDNGPRETSSFPQICRRRTGWQRHRHGGRTRRRAGADERGSAITLPKVKPDAELDADEADTDNEGVDEAEGQAVMRDRKEKFFEEGTHLMTTHAAQMASRYCDSVAAARSAAGKGNGEDRIGRERNAGGPNPYTRATKGQKKETRSNPTRAQLQEPKAHARGERSGPEGPTKERSMNEKGDRRCATRGDGLAINEKQRMIREKEEILDKRHYDSDVNMEGGETGAFRIREMSVIRLSSIEIQEKTRAQCAACICPRGVRDDAGARPRQQGGLKREERGVDCDRSRILSAENTRPRMGGSYVEEIPVKESAVAHTAIKMIKILKAGQIEIADMKQEGAMCAKVKAIAQNERRSEHVRRRENEKGCEERIKCENNWM
ncbi:hypothetical protein B0H13DRAFT_1929758 [Mycena leptocephala]|nr:hypothetical protein B0H13DRAFT_1929758 [Mycena leptocephala]